MLFLTDEFRKEDGTLLFSRYLFMSCSQVSYASVTPSLSDKQMYPYFFRTSAPDTAVNPARIELMRQFGWRKAATLHQSRAVFDAVSFVFSPFSSNIELITVT